MALIVIALIVAFVTTSSDGWSPLAATPSRREVINGIPTLAGIISTGVLPTSASAAAPLIASRLDTTILNMPSPSRATEFNGVDNLYFPSWMKGTWLVTQTLVNASTPLGLKFVGGPNGVERIARETMKEFQERIGQPVSLQLRFIETRWGVAEDRLWNVRERLDAFAGKSVVSSVDYANVGGSNRPSVLAMGGKETDPLQTTVVRFRGPAAQKTFVTSHGAQQMSPTEWAGFELDRSIFALTNQNTAPPLTTDQELIWSLQQVDEDHVRGRFRLAGYLNAQSDTLYFEARNRAVSLQDYALEFERIKTTQ